MTLPKWVVELKVGGNCGRAYKALAIAMEELKKCGAYETLALIEKMGGK